MKSIKLLFYFFLFCPSILLGQNLIPNGSFEDTARRVTPLFGPKHWNSATREGWNYFTPYNNLSSQHLDYSSPKNIAGFQTAKHGIAYIGILVYHLSTVKRSQTREYAQVQLTRPLKKDSTYCLQLHLSMADSLRFASKGMLGVYFSSSLINVNTTGYLNLIPQIIISPNSFIENKVSWEKFEFTYKATGVENHLLIGNFNDTNHIDTLDVGGKYHGSFYYFDDVWLSHCDSLPDTTIGIVERDLNKQVELYPNPSKDYLNIELQDKTTQISEIQVLNLIGQEQSIAGIEKIQSKATLETSNLSPGVYLLQLITDKGILVRKFVKE